VTLQLHFTADAVLEVGLGQVANDEAPAEPSRYGHDADVQITRV
jgi:hypothetical protein